MDNHERMLLYLLDRNLEHMKAVVGTHHSNDTQVLDICLHMQTLIQQLGNNYD